MGTVKFRVGTETIDVDEDASDEELRALAHANSTLKQGTAGDNTPPPPSPMTPEGAFNPETMKTAQSGLETVAPLVGGVGGAVAGGVAGGPVGASAGGAGGAALGELAPLLRPYTTGEPAPSFTQIGAQAGKTGMFSILTDLVTRGILSPAGRFLGRKFTHADEPLNPAVQRTQDILEQRGSSLTAGQMEVLRNPESDRLVRTAETIADSSITSRRVNRTYADQQAIGEDLIDDMATRLTALPDSDVSALLTNEIKYQFEHLVKPVRNEMYKKAFQLLPGPVVPTGALKKELTANGSKDHWKKVVAAIEGEKDSVNTALTSFDPSGKFAIDRISLQDAVNIRSELHKLANKRTEDDAVRNTAGRMAKLFNTAIDQALPPNPQGVSGAALTASQKKGANTAAAAREALDKADKYFGETQDLFRGKLLRKALDKLQQEPGKLENVLLASNSVDTIKAVRQAYGDKLFSKEIEPRLTAAFLAGSKNTDGSWNLESLWTRLRGMGEETGKAAFGDARYKELHELANFFEHINTRAGGKLGVAVSLMQAGAVGAVLGLSPMQSPGKAVGTLLVTLTPTALGHLVGNPELLRSFRRGLQLSYGAGRPVPLLSETMKKLTALTVSHNAPFEFNTGRPDPAVLQPERQLTRQVDPRTGRAIPQLEQSR